MFFISIRFDGNSMWMWIVDSREEDQFEKKDEYLWRTHTHWNIYQTYNWQFVMCCPYKYTHTCSHTSLQYFKLFCVCVCFRFLLHFSNSSLTASSGMSNFCSYRIGMEFVVQHQLIVVETLILWKYEFLQFFFWPSHSFGALRLWRL